MNFWDGERSLKNFGEFLGVRVLSPKIPPKIGEILGVGTTSILWIFGVSPQMNSYCRDSPKIVLICKYWVLSYAKVAKLGVVEATSNTYSILTTYSVNPHFRKIVILWYKIKIIWVFIIWPKIDATTFNVFSLNRCISGLSNEALKFYFGPGTAKLWVLKVCANRESNQVAQRPCLQ